MFAKITVHCGISKKYTKYANNEKYMELLQCNIV